ncbi:MAG: twin-arginine translocase TatA/TatE family subunit, partial [Pseudomonadota bacterium]
MLDIGFMEIVVIGAIALIVVGPKELPVLLRTVGKYAGKARGM